MDHYDKEEKIKALLFKGVADILPSRDYVESLLRSNRKLTIYCGFDPSAPTLHIGNAIQLRKLRHFQDLGHKIIFLIGDFTARIGDPDKLSVRKPLTEKEVKTNLRMYKKQASKFIRFTGKNPAIVKFNSAWLGEMKFAEVITLSSHMTVDQMLKRDMFVKRMEEGRPVYVHEFLYPLMQGYDSVVMNVDGEVGGNDQLFNMLTGRTLLKQLKNKNKFVVTTKLLEDSTGKKMGKSEGNMVSFLDSPEYMFGKVMSWNDELLVPGFELCTDRTLSEVQEIVEKLAQGTNPRDIKLLLAHDIVTSVFDATAADKAKDSFIKTFQYKEVTDSIPEVSIKGRTLEAIILDERLVTSKSELRRLVESRAVSNFGTKELVTLETLKTSTVEGVYKIGKNRFIKLLKG